jgi:hypothetical protein
MKRWGISFLATTIALLICTAPVRAQLVYSFEGDLQGFAANGGGTTITADTIGATHGAGSLKASVVAGATFVGALTSTVPPAIGDPPGVNHVLFDMTIAPGEEYTGGFANIGVTVFGATQPGPGQQFGLPVQFADYEPIGGKTAGTYHNVRIDLSSATHPTTFAPGQSFNQIFGPNPGAPNDIIPTGFQFFLNKSNDQPLTVYIDNVRVVAIPEPATWLLVEVGLGCVALPSRRRNG